jgi:hypothetical protein
VRTRSAGIASSRQPLAVPREQWPTLRVRAIMRGVDEACLDPDAPLSDVEVRAR